jgi:hypothetical protein
MVSLRTLKSHKRVNEKKTGGVGFLFIYFVIFSSDIFAALLRGGDF